MRIDDLINSLQPHTKEAIIIVNKETIDEIIKEFDDKIDGYGTFDKGDGVGYTGIHRRGMEIYFLEFETYLKQLEK